MKKEIYELSLRMISELELSYESLCDDIALLLCINKVLPFEDMSNDESMDDLLEKSYSMKSMLLPLLDYRKNESGVMEAVAESGLFSFSMLHSLREIFQNAAEQHDFSASVFSPYDVEPEEMQFRISEFMIRLLSVYRMKSVIKDLMDGMVEYGRDAYVIGDDDDEEDGYDMLASLQNMEIADLFREWPCYLGNGDDSDEEQIHKAKLCDLIKELLKYTDKEK